MGRGTGGWSAEDCVAREFVVEAANAALHLIPVLAMLPALAFALCWYALGSESTALVG